MKFWQQLHSKLQENKKVYLLTVIQNAGSSPGRKGFKMLVSEDGFIYGSIGGGVMEFDLVEEIKGIFKQKEHPIFIRKQIHQGTGKDKSGMICSGEQTVVFHPLTQNHIPIVTTILQCLENNKQKTISFSPTGIEFIENTISEKCEASITSETAWSFKEQIAFKETVYIVGGGHVGLAVSQVCKLLNFKVVVFDNRTNLNTLNDNIFAHHKQVVNYADIGNYINQGSDSYVVIMTNKYTDDKLVLSQLLRKHHKFIGVLGSKAKLKTMWEVLQKEGFSIEELSKVKAPIGLHIKSQTPEEIAISIAAELIMVKNKNL